MEVYLHDLHSRIQPNGGLCFTPHGKDRPDATAWGTIILSHSGYEANTIKGSRDYLATYQKDNGSVSLSADHPESIWPTSISILAWGTSKPHHAMQKKAIQFLLNSSGEHWTKNPETTFRP